MFIQVLVVVCSTICFVLRRHPSVLNNLLALATTHVSTVCLQLTLWHATRPLRLSLSAFVLYCKWSLDRGDECLGTRLYCRWTLQLIKYIFSHVWCCSSERSQQWVLWQVNIQSQSWQSSLDQKVSGWRKYSKPLSCYTSVCVQCEKKVPYSAKFSRV